MTLIPRRFRLRRLGVRPTLSGSTEMRALRASSKFNGCNDTGLAFGILPHKKASGIARLYQYGRSWSYTSAEAVASEATSASCYDSLENIRVVTIIMPERKLRKIKREIILADVVKRTHNSALEERPKRIEVLGMNFSAHILAFSMVNGFVRIARLQVFVANPLICCDKTNFIVNRPAHEAFKRRRRGIFDYLANYIAFTGDCANNANLSRADTASTSMLSILSVSVFVLAADESFIHLDLAHELGKVGIYHRRTDTMAHIPGRSVVAAPDLSVDLKGADTLLTLGHKVNDLEPRLKRIVGVFKYRLCNDRETVAVSAAAVLVLAYPMERTGLEFIYLLAVAAWAVCAIRPAHIAQEPLAGFLGGKALRELAKGHTGFNGQRLLTLCLCLHDRYYNTWWGGCQVQHNRPNKQNEYCRKYRTLHPERNKASRIKYAAAYPDRLAASYKRYKTINREKLRPKNIERSAKYYATHREQIKKYSTLYRAIRPEVHRQSAAKRRALKRSAPIGDIEIITKWIEQWKAKRKVRCYWCGEKFPPNKCHMDHIISLARGGKHSIENLAISCFSCNSRKRAKSLDDWNAVLVQPVLL